MAAKAARKRAKKKGGQLLAQSETGREPNGRTSRRHADVRGVGVEARMRTAGLSRREAETTEAGHVLGLLRLKGRITEPQYDAGLRFGMDYGRYYAMTGIPFPSARAQNLSRVKGIGADPDPVNAIAAANRVMRLETVIGAADTNGCPVRTLIRRVCVEDRDDGVWQPHMLKHLGKGLTALAVHYGVADAKAG